MKIRNFHQVSNSRQVPDAHCDEVRVENSVVAFGACPTPGMCKVILGCLLSRLQGSRTRGKLLRPTAAFAPSISPFPALQSRQQAARHGNQRRESRAAMRLCGVAWGRATTRATSRRPSDSAIAHRYLLTKVVEHVHHVSARLAIVL